MIVGNFNLHSTPPTSRSSLYLGRTILCIIALNLGACGCGNPLGDSFKDKENTPLTLKNHHSLRAAVRAGDVEEVKKLLEEGGVNVNERDSLGHTLLREAIERGEEEVVRILLEKGADPNAKSSYCGTPLEQLTQEYRGVNTKILKLLLDHGANVNATDKYGKEFMQRAMDKKQIGAVKLLLETGRVKFDKNKVASWACDQDDLEMIQFLLDKKIITGVDLNTKDSSGYTPLGNAISRGNEELVELLSQTENIEPNTENKYGNTPLNQAINNGSKEMVKLLLQVKGIKVNKLRNYSNSDTPLIQAVVLGYAGITKLLLGHPDIKVNKTHPSNGNTALHAAVIKGSRKIIEILIKHGADPNSVNNAGLTPEQMTNDQQLRNFLQMTALAAQHAGGGN